MINHLDGWQKLPYSGNLGHYRNGGKYKVVNFLKDIYRKERTLTFMKARADSLNDTITNAKRVNESLLTQTRNEYNEVLNDIENLSTEIETDKIILTNLIGLVKDPFSRVILQYKMVDRLPANDLCKALHYCSTAVYEKYHVALDELEVYFLDYMKQEYK